MWKVERELLAPLASSMSKLTPMAQRSKEGLAFREVGCAACPNRLATQAAVSGED